MTRTNTGRQVPSSDGPNEQSTQGGAISSEPGRRIRELTGRGTLRLLTPGEEPLYLGEVMSVSLDTEIPQPSLLEVTDVREVSRMALQQFSISMEGLSRDAMYAMLYGGGSWLHDSARLARKENPSWEEMMATARDSYNPKRKMTKMQRQQLHQQKQPYYRKSFKKVF